jgi:hypothetical protein
MSRTPTGTEHRASESLLTLESMAVRVNAFPTERSVPKKILEDLEGKSSYCGQEWGRSSEFHRLNIK